MENHALAEPSTALDHAVSQGHIFIKRSELKTT